MIKIGSKSFYVTLFSSICILATVGFSLYKTNDSNNPSSTIEKTIMSGFKPEGLKEKFTGKNLVKNSNFIGRVKITKLKEKGKEKTYEMPLEPDSIGAQAGHKTFPFVVKFDVYEAEVLDSYKNSKNHKTIEIADTGIIDEDIIGDMSQIQLTEGAEFVVYLNYTGESNRYSFTTLADGIFKIQNDGKTMKNATRQEDYKIHKKFVEDSKN